MTNHDLANRINAVLRPYDDTPWLDLMQLYAEDREAFYVLAVGGIGYKVDSFIDGLARLAWRVRRMVWDKWRVTNAFESTCYVCTQNDSIAVHAALLKKVKRFLRSLERGDRWHTGAAQSEAEKQFKLQTS